MESAHRHATGLLEFAIPIGITGIDTHLRLKI